MFLRPTDFLDIKLGRQVLTWGTGDPDGRDPNINNSEMRYLIGVAREISRDFNGSVQYYVE